MNCKTEYIIFGASALGKIAREHINGQGGKVIAFCDNAPSKHNTDFLGVPVIAPRALRGFPDAAVVIASQYHVAIAAQLIEMGFGAFGNFYLKGYKTPTVDFYDYRNRTFETDRRKLAFIAASSSGANTTALYGYFSKNADKTVLPVLINESERGADYYYDIITSRISFRDYDGEAPEGKVNIQLWHGFPLKGMNYMNRDWDFDREAGHRQWAKTGYVMSYSQLYTTAMSACFGITASKFIITGMPRNDLLFSHRGAKPLRDIYGIAGHEKTAVYMPTFRENCYGCESGLMSGYFFAARDFDAGRLNGFLEANDIKLIVKLHQIDTVNLPDDLKNRSHIIVENGQHLKSGVDFYEVLAACDCLITDYSSVYFDFLLLDKPIIFTPLDLEDYRRSPGLIFEPYDFFTPGPKAFTLDSLMTELKRCLGDSEYYKAERETVKRLAHYYTDGMACGRVYDFVVNEIMGSEKP